MTKILALENIQVTLPELLDTLSPGDEVVLTRNHQPVAKIVAETPSAAQRKPRKPGNCQGLMTIVSDDEEHLNDFADYM